MFADDTAVLLEIKNKANGTKEIQQLMQKIYKHFTLNKLKMNVEKTSTQGKNITGKINVNNTDIEILSKETSQSYLGIMVSANLDWKDQINALRNKIRKGLFALAKLKKTKQQ